ncbi:MAG: hypothetical protein ACM3UR_01640 [Bacteroidota bacterium]|jgi:hypothetical protein|nr:hypothetical protein [Ignavibacteria bacterium]HEX2961953.1 hypothetical protein [Ignavibacteriales bacterium]MCU7500592.1 hypothetical protein [Ignavibacteria bacterium]MCU7513997.1 hypothetical protein [Ignavibacteria bacterium]MCU7521265.1 hypothetical protein [Ignavibacteria bacterium]
MGIKDKLVSKGAEKVVNTLFEDMGKVSGLSIDSRNKAMKLTLDLKGETAPLSINIMEYEILEEESRYFIVIHKLKASREWMNIAFGRFFKGMKIPVPDKYSFVIKQAL